MASLLQELKRRRVFNTIASYGVVAWLLIQIAVAVEAPLGLPSWLDTFVIVGLIIGFPVCAVLAWIYDLRGRAIRRTGAADADAGPVELNARDRVAVFVAAAFSILLVATAAYLLIGRGAPAYESVAILPFVNTGGDASVEYLATGMRDGLAGRLSRFDGLRVKLGTAAVSTGFDARSLGESLGVGAICTGSFVQAGDSIEFVTELVDTRDGSLIWRDRFSSDSVGLIGMETEIASRLPAQLGFAPTEAEMAEIARARTTNPAAHRLYLLGRHFWNQRTREGLTTAIEYYERAVDLDPNYALAHAGLADANLMLLGWGLEPPDAVAPLVVENARRAIQRDPTLAEPHAALGYLRTIYDRDWAAARAEFLRAIELNGNYGSAHHWYAFLLLTEGNKDAAIEAALLARESEPLSPIINAEVGYFLLMDRQYARAVVELEAARGLDPNYPFTLAYLALAYHEVGRPEDAVAPLRRWRAVVAGDPALATFGSVVLTRLGFPDEARAIFEALRSMAEQQYVMPAALGLLAGALGDNDNAFAYFDEAVERNALVASWLRDPLLDGLRDEARYGVLMERIGLEP